MGKNTLLNDERIRTLFEKKGLLAVYLFGSRADGTANEQSDYDFGILFSSPVRIEDTAIALFALEEEMADILKCEVDVIALDTASIEKRFLIISKGLLIYSRDDDKRTDFEDLVIKEYLDFKPVLEKYRKEVKEAITEGGFYA